MKLPRRAKLFTTAGAAVALILVVTTSFYIARGSGDEPTPGFRGDSFVTLVEAPQNYDELVDVDLIAIGRIGDVVKEGWEGPYNEDQLLKDSRGLPLPKLYFTYYKIVLEEMLLDDEDRETEDVFLRLNGQIGRQQANFMPMPKKGMRAMFVLHANPGHHSYSSGPWGIVSLEGDVPSFFDWDRTSGDFKADDDVDKFIEKVKQRLEAK